MSNFPIVIQESEKRTQLILCPATLDGVACATILTRFLPGVEYQLFCPEDRVSSMFEYPAVKDCPASRDLILAGFPLPENQREAILQVLSRTRSPGIQWYSHHHWSSSAIDAIRRDCVELILDPSADTTAEVLIRRLKIEDDISRAAAAMAMKGYIPSGRLADWPYVLLAVKDEPYEIRHAFAPLFEGQDRPDAALAAVGKTVFQDLKDHIESSAQYRISANDLKVAVVGAPMTFRYHYRLIAQLVEEKLACPIILLFFDSLQQILLIRGRFAQEGLDFLSLMENLEAKLHCPIRIFDRNLLLVGPSKDLKALLDETIEGLRTL